VLAATGCALERGSSVAASARHGVPAWRGFNLLEKYLAARQGPFVERDFEWMAQWQFDFARLPMDYRAWTDAKDPARVDDRVLAEIDQAIEWGRRYGVHVSLNLHRAPGYCVNPPPEPLDLWTSGAAQAQFTEQWRRFAERYRGIPPEHLSFDLVNEPGSVEEPVYVGVMSLAIEAIRAADQGRLIFVDGLRWGREPVLSLAGSGVAQSTRGYDPMEISHHRAHWSGWSDRWPQPAWPLGADRRGRRWDRERYRAARIRPWQELERRGAGVHVGEWGCFNRTPHDVTLAWMRDLLALWREAGWGWALWNLRGSFGIVDSGRQDVTYERFDRHELDRAMLELFLEDGELRRRPRLSGSAITRAPAQRAAASSSRSASR
jgi:endoglucanase